MPVLIEEWKQQYCAAVQAAFGPRVVFIGLQGSYGRGEAGEHSDIDVVLLLDEVTMDDLKQYRALLAGLPHRELICGFVAGYRQLAGWEKGDLLTFLFDTVPWQGSLQALQQQLGPKDAWQSVITGAGNIYHACVHNYLHERSEEMLAALQKNAFFVLRAACYARTGLFNKRRDELQAHLTPDENALLALPPKLEELTPALLQWAGNLLAQNGRAAG